MKRNDFQKLKILLFILACLIPVFVYVEMFSTNNFNWFSIPNLQELYLESYDTSASQYINFAVHSSTNSDCTISYCWTSKNVSLKTGLNVFREPIDNCSESFRVTLDCGQSTVSFRCSKSTSEASYNASLLAKPSSPVKTEQPRYPLSMFAVLILSVAIALLVIDSSKMDFALSLLLLFTLSSSLLVIQFHLTSLGMNEWVIPLVCVLAWVLVWKKMR